MSDRLVGLEEETQSVVHCSLVLASAREGRQDDPHYGDQLELAEDCLEDALYDFVTSWDAIQRETKAQTEEKVEIEIDQIKISCWNCLKDDIPASHVRCPRCSSPLMEEEL